VRIQDFALGGGHTSPAGPGQCPVEGPGGAQSPPEAPGN